MEEANGALQGEFMTSENRSLWIERAKTFIPEVVGANPILAEFGRKAAIVFHGSVMLGFADEVSDLDFWMVLSRDDLRRLDQASNTRFFAIEACGRQGHVNAEALEDFLERVDRCDMDLIGQLRCASPIIDDGRMAGELIQKATKPMREEVRRAYFFYNYVEMRGERTTCVNLATRNESVALLVNFPKVLVLAMRAAIVLDGEPYPYDKWLYRAAKRSSVAGELIPVLDRCIDHLTGDALRSTAGRQSPIFKELSNLRDIICQAAKEKGIDEPWLGKFWLYFNQSRDAINSARWLE